MGNGDQDGSGEGITSATASFSPFTGRNAQEGNEGQRQRDEIVRVTGAIIVEAGAAPHPPFGHLLPVNGEKERSGFSKHSLEDRVDMLGVIAKVEFFA